MFGRLWEVFSRVKLYIYRHFIIFIVRSNNLGLFLLLFFTWFCVLCLFLFCSNILKEALHIVLKVFILILMNSLLRVWLLSFVKGVLSFLLVVFHKVSHDLIKFRFHLSHFLVFFTLLFVFLFRILILLIFFLFFVRVLFLDFLLEWHFINFILVFTVLFIWEWFVFFSVGNKTLISVFVHDLLS